MSEATVFKTRCPALKLITIALIACVTGPSSAQKMMTRLENPSFLQSG
jgi:hypothetical protein